jgi:FkbM family methyltransferase
MQNLARVEAGGLKMVREWAIKLLSFTGYAVVSVGEKRLLKLGLLGRFWLESLFSAASALSGKSFQLLDVWVERSQSQLGQDLVALAKFGPDHKGYFVEFGATNGQSLSNTWMLEKYFGWNGIVCEPARRWTAAIEKSRSCAIDHRCVYSKSGDQVMFSETSIGELSTISAYSGRDMHSSLRRKSKEYFVETVSLYDLLIQHQAPRFIEFLSIDTEGSEFDILEAFDFSEFTFGLICVEHNYSLQRGKIGALLESHGYIQVLSEYSQFDDWYVLKFVN